MTFPSAHGLEGRFSCFLKHLKPEITAGVLAVPGLCTFTATTTPVHASEQELEVLAWSDAAVRVSERSGNTGDEI